MVVGAFWELSVEHQVCHGVVGVTMEVVEYVVGTVVRRFPVVSLVSFKLVSVYEVIHKLQNTVLEADNFLSLRVEVEWHVIVTLNVHELVV